VREWSHERELDWWLLEDPLHDGVRRLVAELNHLQAHLPALWEGDDLPHDTFGWLDPDDAAHSVFAFWRRAPSGGAPVVVVANLTPVPRPGYQVGVPHGGTWSLVLDTDDARWGGSGHRSAPAGGSAEAVGDPWQAQAWSLMIALPPLSITVWIPESALSA
jgi:1,4-alpha-glucan branching enzyme